MSSTRSFPIKYSPLSRWLMTPLLLGARHGTIQLTPDALVVRMGWAFRAEILRSSIRRAARHRDVRWAIGVHADLRFTSWLVNGSTQGIVFLDLDPAAKGRSGPFPITIRRLGLGLDDPDGFLRALGVG
ncbi:MAG TPA: hypothetical protein VE800_09025 [Actinomycetota bacterium]|nr:hypothetical protein [Actinomycetota bacterium]